MTIVDAKHSAGIFVLRFGGIIPAVWVVRGRNPFTIKLETETHHLGSYLLTFSLALLLRKGL